jgi:molybdenum cofactor synthesis domain-containing protein
MSRLIEIIAIGNELLLGIVQDTNTHWLCKQLTGLGGRVARAALVPDDLQAIGDELKRALARKRDLIITTGGLGPTQDDMTLQALAEATGRPLEENPEALKMVEERYLQLFEAGRVDRAGLTESRRKMAQLPRGATPLYNSVGTAPGVLIREGKSLIAALPGVPTELVDIFTNSLQPHLRELFGDVFYLEKTLIVDTNDESLLAPILKEFQAAWPKVYIKSRPKGFEEGMKVAVTIAISGEHAVVEGALARLIEELQKRLGREGFPSTLVRD